MKIKDAHVGSLKPHARLGDDDPPALTILEEYGLSVKVIGLLESELACVYLRDLQQITAEQVLGMPGGGPGTLAEIRRATEALRVDWNRRQREGKPMAMRDVFSEIEAAQYTDGKRTLFVSDGISGGRQWGTFRRKPSGSLQRVKSPMLPMRTSRARAQVDLDAWAASRGYRRLEA